MIDLKVLYLVPIYDWLVSIITYLQKPEIKNFTSSRPTSFIVNNSSASLFDIIINKSHMHDNDSARQITLREITLSY